MVVCPLSAVMLPHKWPRAERYRAQTVQGRGMGQEQERGKHQRVLSGWHLRHPIPYPTGPLHLILQNKNSATSWQPCPLYDWQPLLPAPLHLGTSVPSQLGTLSAALPPSRVSWPLLGFLSLHLSLISGPSPSPPYPLYFPSLTSPPLHGPLIALSCFSGSNLCFYFPCH